MWAYIGISAGDLASGLISHKLESRKKAILGMMTFALIGVLVYLFAGIKSANMLYAICCWLGLGTGYWAMFVTVGAEQFGTNLRATAATTIPNMVRGAVVPMSQLFTYLKLGALGFAPLTVILSAAIVGVAAFGIGFYSTWTIEESHGRNLDFIEE